MKVGCKWRLGEISHGVWHTLQWLLETWEEACALVGKVDFV